jgi:hypothetical protein
MRRTAREISDSAHQKLKDILNYREDLGLHNVGFHERYMDWFMIFIELEMED